ncbi:hypothetical protein LO749_20825 [Paracoccus denitrificans]|uniref:virion core protein, T7 gp14 family n=1 Tax=Paracoccus denitrificans TaxID=266 RepID=UPI001E3EA595|nr:hypothetical protein [Paracoccus denitrificans]UFS66939.1 hypothetical protein LO749_20825 [Paracoccus denitrificans]
MASIGLSVVQAGVAYTGATEAAKAQADYANQNARNAARTAEANWRALGTREQQEQAESLQQRQQQEIEASKAAASAEVAAGQAGVSGNSVGGILQDIYGSLGRNLTIIGTNRANARSGIAAEMENVGIGAQNQINSVPQPETPSLLPYGLQAFSQGLNAYSQYKQRKG